MDFEIGIHVAYLNIFPQSSLGVCLFHLGQACWRKICALGDRLNITQIPGSKAKLGQRRTYIASVVGMTLATNVGSTFIL